MSKPLLSIIIPAYHASETIGKLIDSINCDNEFINLITLYIVNDINDDEETSKTTDEINKYIKKYKNIVKLDMPHTKYSGDARNFALDKINSKYVTFADSDDLYDNHEFRKLINYIKDKDFKMLVFNYKSFDENNEYHNSILSLQNKLSKLDQYEGYTTYLSGGFRKIGNELWNKIYNVDIIKKNNLEFVYKKRIGEDLIFNVEYFSYIDSYLEYNHPIYLYYRPSNSNNIIKTKYKNAPDIKNYYDCFKKIATEIGFLDYEKYIGIFFVRRIYSSIVSESASKRYTEGIKNINLIYNDSKIRKCIKKSCFWHFNFINKIFYIVCVFKLYYIIYPFFYIADKL